ncbi:CzcP family heavy metal (cobalt-zinc-cadmium) translocating P-type ATPase [Tenacibaculum maritimum]|uniref:heavy metal translocating P-type ATPase n=1 Tax=Tenacibaculum maritimum TaxID=107401 RepID=UPI0012E4A23E|nr:heavy metal translocating P-type ATPase [Tenacibaculum maritimum]CAA0141799.1 CzcP family heavy metal (cobalt-zinc-cadmium) translocating P-type ATPase [Tenacibaculum maritimum]CAA0141827.1 CzcP family heavy metal (cobalt-zinc-cadmium) translocating P-type ATPase [Tenacibaculum maritimum]CAA0141840.1 CzcP family heavy metal (cobalt-zinc-cadmium) translocating P-type ATPase [Tenacibaculum maritimum]CAA0147437.1 CzcP family heavy metal (cobalt-zinc-cadmium) translocating P-type ATPase [Tenacib
MSEKHLKAKEHDHSHGGIFGESTELYFAILSGAFFFLGVVLEKLTGVSEIYTLGSFVIAFFFGGWFTTKEAIEKIRKGEFEIDFLMLIAALGAAYINKWEEGALLLFLFSLGHSLENYAMGKAKKSIEALGELSPKKVLVKRGETTAEILIEELKLEDIIVVKPNTKIGADGVIIKGHTSINQASITGESMPVDKEAIQEEVGNLKFEEIDKRNVVYTGTINGDNLIEVLVLKLNEDSTISRLIKMVNEVETKKSPTQLFTKKFEKWFVPIVIVLVFLLCFAYLIIDESFEESIYRAITVLVAASPCALAISTPSAVLSGVARGAKGGVLIKGGRALEDLGSLTTIAFDKTGTLTEGTPRLTNIITVNNTDKETLLELVLSVESLSNHPLAKAISKEIIKKYATVNKGEVSNIEAFQGMGIRAIYREKEAFIGNLHLMETKAISISEEVREMMKGFLEGGNTTMLVAYNKKLIGILTVMDTPRKFAKETLQSLKKLGIKKMVMLTGDHQNVGEAIANEIGLSEVRGGLLPEEKVSAIQQLQKKNTKIAMVGDGVNDAPAMASSSVGIAMGAAGSDVALETADIALMSDKIEKLPFVIGLSRTSKIIIKQNLWMSLGVVALLIPATLFGVASIGPVVIIHEGSTLLVVLNALRLLRFKED